MSTTDLLRNVFCASVPFLVAIVPAQAQWLQWGGPTRDFKVQTTGLADQWPDDGPKRLWQRELGDGFSSIVVDGDRLYTVYHKQPPSGDEYVVALNARTGETVWEFGYRAPQPPGEPKFPGPNATPLIVGDRLFTTGVDGLVHCFNKPDGKVLWQVDLPTKFGAAVPDWGYSASPLAYKNTIIVPVGRARDAAGATTTQRSDAYPSASLTPNGSSLVALDQATGDTVWKNLDLDLGHSSPTLIRFAGEDQLVYFAVPGLVGVNPDSGELLWQHAFPQRQVSTVTVNPVWNGRDTLFCANEQTGRAVKLTKDGTRTSAEELWSSRKAAIGMATPVYVGDVLIGPKQGQAPFLLAIDLRTGERVWYDRTVPAGAVLYADGKLITLTQSGELGLAALTPKGPELKSRCQVAEALAFTPPTLVGTTLYVRDRRHIVALDLSPSR